MTSFFLAGVGGQGILLTSMILSRLALSAGRDVKMSEIHGMAQRGGSVVSHVRIGGPGEEVLSPVIGLGEADILLALEEMEALRWADYVNPETGRVFVSRHRVPPLSVLAGRETYPQQTEELIRQRFPRHHLIDAADLAEAVGSRRAANVVLLGGLAGYMDAPAEQWLQAIADSVKPAYREINQAAFRTGCAAAGRQSQAAVPEQ